MAERIINHVAETLRECPFIKGIVLGGSRATGTATDTSDIDIGIYYDPSDIDFDRLNEAAKQLDDDHRENLVCREGGWGNWVNCGGWLVTEGYQVDLILRDIGRVRACIAQTDVGEVSAHYQTGHPHAYINVMYRGELASGRLLYAPDQEIAGLKRRAETYPDSLRDALMSKFLFEARFSCALARKNAYKGDLYYTVGHLFRGISALNQVLFAINRVYCLNEKKAIQRICSFGAAPADYGRRVSHVLSLAADTEMEAVDELERLVEEVEQL